MKTYFYIIFPVLLLSLTVNAATEPTKSESTPIIQQDESLAYIGSDAQPSKLALSASATYYDDAAAPIQVHVTMYRPQATASCVNIKRSVSGVPTGVIADPYNLQEKDAPVPEYYNPTVSE